MIAAQCAAWQHWQLWHCGARSSVVRENWLHCCEVWFLCSKHSVGHSSI